MSWHPLLGLVGAICLGACGLIGKTPSPSESSSEVEGAYWWQGTRLTFGDDDTWGQLSRISGALVYGTTANLLLKGEAFVLTIPECQSGITLKSSRSSGEVLAAAGVDCAIDDTAQALGYVRWRIEDLRLDLTRRAMDYRLCVTDASERLSCSQNNAVFVPMENTTGVGGAVGSDGTSELVNFADSVRGWQLNNDLSVSWQCGEVASSGEGCEPGTKSIRTGGRRGTLHRMKDGRYYLAGYDCYVPNPYDGEPIRCGDSFEGMADVGIPTAWIYKFSLSGVDLHFEAEMRGKDYKYYLIVEGPVVPL
jgi:hypothetical protein